MTNQEKNILWLDLFENLSYKKKIKLLELIEPQENLRSVFLKKSEIRQLLANEEFNQMALCLTDEFLNGKIIDYINKGIELITFYNPNYPYILKEISAPPLCLYCKGDISLLNSPCFAIIGTRRPTDYGIVATKQYVKSLIEANLTIVSGLAMGIDSVAHKSALENNGKTIAVLAGGIDFIYPQTNIALANKIMEANLVISEYPPETKPQAYYFPIRNRIIAGLSKGIFVPEMGEKSGSLHTVNYALEFNREIFILPGKITSPMSKGTNAMIKNLQGAMTTSPQDIIDTLHLTKSEEKEIKQIDMTSQMILDFVQSDKKTFQEILDYMQISTNELNSMLLSLELEGLIVKLANNSYIMA